MSDAHEADASSELLILYDEFTELEALSAFFCDGVAALCLSREEWLDERSAQGVGYFSQMLKERFHDATRRLDRIRNPVRRA